jgi:SHAQKYF class myb-like DNA-binding protein
MAAEEPDAATAALIAKMMAEENPYDDDVYGMYADDSDDDDYGRPRKKKKKTKPKAAPKPPKEPKPPKAPKAPKPPPPTGEDGEALSASGRRKRKDTGAVRQKARPWTEEEEKLFLEALALHGRDWKKCAEHVGTRDHRAFTSHAQKWFIKMCLQGKPLPKKVAESGEGYTLSGKPLDPNSAAARQYGFRADTLIAFDTVPDEDAPPESLVGRELARDDDSEIVPLGGNVASYDAEKLAFEIATRDAEGALSSAFVADSPAFRARRRLPRRRRGWRSARSSRLRSSSARRRGRRRPPGRPRRRRPGVPPRHRARSRRSTRVTARGASSRSPAGRSATRAAVRSSSTPRGPLRRAPPAGRTRNPSPWTSPRRRCW